MTQYSVQPWVRLFVKSWGGFSIAKNMGKISVREKCSNKELFLDRIFQHSVRIQENTD